MEKILITISIFDIFLAISESEFFSLIFFNLEIEYLKEDRLYSFILLFNVKLVQSVFQSQSAPIFQKCNNNFNYYSMLTLLQLFSHIKRYRMQPRLRTLL